MKYLLLTLSAFILAACNHTVKPVDTAPEANKPADTVVETAPVEDTNAAPTEEDALPEPSQAELEEKFSKLFPDMTDTFTYAAPDGFSCNTAGTAFTGKYINCENADKSTTMRLGTLPYLGDIQDIEGVANYVSENLTENGATVVDTKVLNMPAKKITAKVKMQDKEAFMTSYVFDKNNVAYTINMIEMASESALADTFDTFVQSIKVADKAVEKVNLEEVFPPEAAADAVNDTPTEE